MPPKKKGATTAKIPKQESLKETLIESEISSSEPTKIPKRPFLLYVNYDSLTKVHHIRIKLWKIHSCSRSHPVGDAGNVDPFGWKQSREHFTNMFKSSTIKKSLKHVKKFGYDPSSFSKQRFMKRLCSTWRLKSFFLSVQQKFKNYDVLNRFLNSSLKNCYLLLNTRGERIDPKLVAAFMIVKKSKLIIDSDLKEISMHIHPSQLWSYRRLKKFLPVRDIDDSGYELARDQIIVNAPEAFEAIWYRYPNVPTRGSKINPDLSSLPNLQKLRLSCMSERSLGEKIDDLSFVKQYPKLETLRVHLYNCEIETLDYVTNLQELKEFKFASVQKYIRKIPMISLPKLTQLETIALHLHDSPIFSLEHIKDFLSKNKGLKDLSLGLKIQDIGTLFEENEDSTLPKIEKLRLNFVKLERPYAGGVKRITQVLKTHDSIKELIIIVSQNYADFNTILLKDGVAKMKSLEKLTLEFGMSGGLEENKYKHLKDVFTNQTGLVALELDISCDAIATRELGTILDGLMKLKNLKKFRLKAMLTKMTPAAFNKLSGFIASLRNVKSLELDLKGLSQEDEEQLRLKLLPKIPLSDGPFSFNSNITTETYNTNIDIDKDELDLD